jgi:hypothetical protein
MVIIQVPWRCNVPHNIDLRNATYESALSTAIITIPSAAASIVAATTSSVSASNSQPIQDMDLLSEGTKPVTTDKAMQLQ